MNGVALVAVFYQALLSLQSVLKREVSHRHNLPIDTPV